MPMANHTWIHTPMAYKIRPPTPDNILLDHNLLIITQYQNIKKRKTSHSNICQLPQLHSNKRQKIHSPPLKIINLKTYIQECNPDKNIITNKPTIQVQALESNIYDHNGRYITTITTDRLHWLWNQFSHNKHPYLTNFLQPPHKTLQPKYDGLYKDT